MPAKTTKSKPTQKASKPKVSKDSKVFLELKQDLIQKKNELLQKLDSWEDKSSPSGLKEQGDLVDIAAEINDDVLSSAMTENEIELLNQIEIALKKIELGTYGICEGTKKKIPIARLKAIPWTPFTVEYAEIFSKTKAKQNFRSTSADSYAPQSSEFESSD
jgi:DnaK suppressor protein